MNLLSPSNGAMVLRLVGIVVALAGILVAVFWDPQVCVVPASGCASPFPGSPPCVPPSPYCSHEHVAFRIVLAVVATFIGIALFVVATVPDRTRAAA